MILDPKSLGLTLWWSKKIPTPKNWVQKVWLKLDQILLVWTNVILTYGK